jgi:branched-chain amino acid transport system substrate-binding protein
MAGLTQEALATRAGVSVRAISDLERGVNRSPQPATLQLLTQALQLSSKEQALFEETARASRLADPAASAPGTPSPAAQEAAVKVSETINQWVHLLLERLRANKAMTGIASAVLMVAVLAGAVFVSGVPRALSGQRTTLCLATDLPISGGPDNSVWGIPLQNAVDLAVAENQNLGSGYTLQTIHFDDVSAQSGNPDPQTGANNVRQMVRNSCVIGMVGPFNSDVASAEMPTAAEAGLLMISPSNTNPALTLRPYASAFGLDFDTLHPADRKNNYFRITGNDTVQGVVDADFLFQHLGARQIYVVNDNAAYGEELASFVIQVFQLQGGTIEETDRLVPTDSSDIAAVAARIVAKAPDAVFYGGTTDGGGGLLKGQLAALGYHGAFMGGDAVDGDSAFLQQVVSQGGLDAADNTYGTQPYRDPSTFTTGRAARFLHDYHSRYPGQGINAYAADAYDAAMVVITALRHLIQTGQPVNRSTLVDAVLHIQYSGVTGNISFDTNGDISHAVFSVYGVKSGNWSFIEQVST